MAFFSFFLTLGNGFFFLALGYDFLNLGYAFFFFLFNPRVSLFFSKALGYAFFSFFFNCTYYSSIKQLEYMQDG